MITIYNAKMWLIKMILAKKAALKKIEKKSNRSVSMSRSLFPFIDQTRSSHTFIRVFEISVEDGNER